MVLDDGVRYVQAALANPAERLARWHTLAIGAFGLDGPLLLWAASSGLVPKMHCRWSGFYEHHERMRTPDGRVFQLARYAARFARTDKRAAVVDPDFSHESGSGAVAGMQMRWTDPVLRDEEGTAPAAAAGQQQQSAWSRGVWRTGDDVL